MKYHPLITSLYLNLNHLFPRRQISFVIILLAGTAVFGMDDWTVSQACDKSTIKYGAISYDVKHAQNQLLRVGNPFNYGTPSYWIKNGGGADGNFGKKTEYAVIAYQKIVFPGQPTEYDGIIGLKTWKKLGCNEDSTPEQSGRMIDKDLDGLDDEYENRLLWRYSPRIYLHSSEEYKPMSVKWFIKNSSMWYSHNNCNDHQVKAKGKLKRRNLDNQKHPTSDFVSFPNCKHSNNIRHSNQFKTTGEEGFFIDIDNGKRKGPVKKKKWQTYGHVYLTPGKKLVIQWWQLYAYNDSVDPVNHEGDWEHSGILLNSKGEIEKVFFFRHNNVRSYNPSEVEFVRGTDRHVSYSAKGSHAQYMKATRSGNCITGFTTPEDMAQALIADRCEKGIKWDTWDFYKFGGIVNIGEENKPLNNAQWIKYSGLWGEIGEAAWAKVNWTSGPWTPSYQGSAWKPF